MPKVWRISGRSVLSPKQDIYHLYHSLWKHSGSSSRKSQKTESRTVIWHPLGKTQPLLIMKSSVVWMSTWDLHKNRPINSQAWMEVGLKGLCPSLITISLLALDRFSNSGSYTLSCVLIGNPMSSNDSSNLEVTQMALVKLNGSQNQPKSQESGQGTLRDERSLTRTAGRKKRAAWDV